MGEDRLGQPEDSRIVDAGGQKAPENAVIEVVEVLADIEAECVLVALGQPANAPHGGVRPLASAAGVGAAESPEKRSTSVALRGSRNAARPESESAWRGSRAGGELGGSSEQELSPARATPTNAVATRTLLFSRITLTPALCSTGFYADQSQGATTSRFGDPNSVMIEKPLLVAGMIRRRAGARRHAPHPGRTGRRVRGGGAGGQAWLRMAVITEPMLGHPPLFQSFLVDRCLALKRQVPKSTSSGDHEHSRSFASSGCSSNRRPGLTPATTRPAALPHRQPVRIRRRSPRRWVDLPASKGRSSIPPSGARSGTIPVSWSPMVASTIGSSTQ